MDDSVMGRTTVSIVAPSGTLISLNDLLRRGVISEEIYRDMITTPDDELARTILAAAEELPMAREHEEG